MKKNETRITVDALKYYVPLYHKGWEAEKTLASKEFKGGIRERNRLENVAQLKVLAKSKIASLCGPLITKEVAKIILSSHMKNKDEYLFDILYYAGLDGLEKGLRNFKVDKINVSSTNYLFQWIITYAKKELSAIEADFGVKPSRLTRYKKISAVRKKLTEQLGRYATNEEVLAYFHSGKANLKNMNGRLDKTNIAYNSNVSMAANLVEEQEKFETMLSQVDLLDTMTDVSNNVRMIQDQDVLFEETLFGAFASSYNFTDEAIYVIAAEIGIIRENGSSVDDKTYRKILSAFKALIADSQGIFVAFLRENMEHFDDIGVEQLLNKIVRFNKTYSLSRYSFLFTNRQIEKR